MSSSSHVSDTAPREGDVQPSRVTRRELLTHGLCALAFTCFMVIIAAFDEPGAFTTMIGFPAGVAALWALLSSNRIQFALICVFVFVVSCLSFLYFGDRPLMTVWLGGLGYVLVGPMILPTAKALAEMRARARRRTRDGGTSAVNIIAVPADVYRLLLASLITAITAGALRVVWTSSNGGDASVLLMLGFVLRDLAGIAVVTGTALAVRSCVRGNPRSQILRSRVVVVVVATALLLAVIFGPGQHLPIAYLAIVPLFWSATTLAVSAAALHAAVTVVAAGFLAQFVGAGPFAAPDNPVVLTIAVQMFAIMGVALSLTVSTAVQQRTAIIEEFEALTETIPDPLLTVDRAGRVTPINAVARTVLLPCDGGQFVERPLTPIEGAQEDIGSPSERALAGEFVKSLPVTLAGGGGGGAGDEHQVYSLSASPLYGPGEAEPEYALLLYRDVSNEHRSVQELRRAHAEATLLFEDAPQGLATLDDTGRIVQANSALAGLLGLPAAELEGRSIEEFSPEGPLDDAVNVALQRPGTLVYDNRTLASADGAVRIVELSIVAQEREGEDGRRILVNVVDNTEREKLHELVTHLADHDELTGLMNRRRFKRELQASLSGEHREAETGALLLIDLDNFKLVNDHLGHQAGDELLVEFAGLLRDAVGPGDVIARFGGDEFVILLPDAGQAEAVAVGSSIVETVSERFGPRGGIMRRVTASIGITSLAEAREAGADPLLLADQLLYDAKHAGKGRFAVRAPQEGTTAPPETVSRSRVEDILRDEAITLDLQPVVAVGSGDVVLAEGLVRVDPSHGTVSTPEFVAAVEAAGLGPHLDICVLRAGVRLLPQLLAARPGFRLLLNVSGQSLMSEDVARVVVEELAAHHVPEGSLILEITESAQVTDFAKARAFQTIVAGCGVSFAVDDFGAGYDPYRYLSELDIDMVKIAGVFVEGMSRSDLDAAIVRSLVRLAAEQGMDTIAEYVSDEAVYRAAQDVGVTFVQGFHLGRPVAAQDFVDKHLQEG
ncbi:EAL domain-containing protein [Corynebacterium sp.]|uniref:bifunctional diguanylate cyclase/phosphodiesterase n=1 Tax=Corynebacterium sp. TaxID=1720 RepID=UPI0026E07D54|nr:EAL domain-containing protein [Corynebacterium sp.]MDO5513133.1 EAL domain-containing protein [Corynebacterium sp.]